jgi:hypothetical protein
MPKFWYAIAVAPVLWSRVAGARPPPVVVELEQGTHARAHAGDTPTTASIEQPLARARRS